jgi:hypothetical protein
METKVLVKATGETKVAVYAPNSSGNMRYNVDGKFYSDKKFNQLFEIVDNNSKPLSWSIQTKALFEEILGNNPNMWIMQQPLRILYNILQQGAARAIELQDEKMIAIFCKLAMYEESDPTSKKYDAEKMEYLFELATQPIETT